MISMTTYQALSKYDVAIKAKIAYAVKNIVILSYVLLLMSCLGWGLSDESPNSIILPQPIILGNQSAHPDKEGIYKIYNIPTGFDSYARLPNGRQGPLVQTTIYRYRAQTPVLTSTDIQIIGTNDIELTPNASTVFPNQWNDTGPKWSRRVYAVASRLDTVYGYPLTVKVYSKYKSGESGDWFQDDLLEKVATAYQAWSSNPAIAQVERINASTFRLVPVMEVDKDYYVSVMIYDRGVSGFVNVLIKPGSPDNDSDGSPNKWEGLYGFNRFDPSDAESDLDADGLSNREEFELGTNPRDSDTDRDGILDNFDPEPLTPETIPPVITWITPVDTSMTAVNDPVSVQVKATDNGPVINMKLLIDGQLISTSSSGEIGAVFTPSTAKEYTVVVIATDYAGNVSATIRQINATEVDGDPLIITGRTIDEFGAPIAGARWLISNEISGITNNAGQFHISHNLTNGQSKIKLSFYFLNADSLGSGTFRDIIVSEEKSHELGDVLLSASPFRSIVGEPLLVDTSPRGVDSRGDYDGFSNDYSMVVNTEFDFPFYGQFHRDLHVSGHGNIEFGNLSESDKLDYYSSYGNFTEFWAPDYHNINIYDLHDRRRVDHFFGHGRPRISPFWSYINLSGSYYQQLFDHDLQYGIPHFDADGNFDYYEGFNDTNYSEGFEAYYRDYAGYYYDYYYSQYYDDSIDYDIFDASTWYRYFVSGPVSPRLNPSLFKKEDSSSISFTWLDGLLGTGSSSTLISFQVQLSASGKIEMSYVKPASRLSYNSEPNAITGISPGLDAGSSELSFDNEDQLHLPSDKSFSQHFERIIWGEDGDGSDFNLYNYKLIFEPRELGGYNVIRKNVERFSEAVLAGTIRDQGIPIVNAEVLLSDGQVFKANESGHFQGVVYRSPVFVASDASGANNGRSWKDAFNKLEDAVKHEEPSDEIWVKKGVYKPRSTLVPV